MSETFLTDGQKVTLREQYKSVPQHEYNLFLIQIERTRLDPFARQIYLILRGGKYMIQASIDGLRLIAERTGQYQGQVGPWWCGPDGEWKDVWLPKTPPSAAKVGVWRKDFKEPLFRVARWDSYAQLNSPTWKGMPDVMIAKCSESLALRSGFPQEMSGIYSEEEMDQAGAGEEVQKVEPTKPQNTAPVPAEKTELKVVTNTTEAKPVEMANESSVGIYLSKWDASYPDGKNRPNPEYLLKLTKAALMAEYNLLPVVVEAKAKAAK
jgi:phage recombination protein Bet